MIARLRARLHGLRRGHQTYDEIVRSPGLFFYPGEHIIPAGRAKRDGKPALRFAQAWQAPPTITPTGRILCHGCDRRWVA